MSDKVAACAQAVNEMLTSHLDDAWGYALAVERSCLPFLVRKPLTRREKVTQWFSERWDRVALAWRVLRGDDIHEDC